MGDLDGACATCGGFYRAYHVMQGIDESFPRWYIPALPYRKRFSMQ
jgi:NADH:ubiquinone oxidoreductase subunit B-like Fe-S oxidoreductase